MMSVITSVEYSPLYLMVFFPWLITADAELGIEIGTLSSEDGVVIEVRWFGLEMPFPNHGGVVAGFTEFDR